MSVNANKKQAVFWFLSQKLSKTREQLMLLQQPLDKQDSHSAAIEAWCYGAEMMGGLELAAAVELLSEAEADSWMDKIVEIDTADVAAGIAQVDKLLFDATKALSNAG